MNTCCRRQCRRAITVTAATAPRDYGADKIKVLEGLKPSAASRYIGSTGPAGLHHLVYEIVDNRSTRLAGFAIKSTSRSTSTDPSQSSTTAAASRPISTSGKSAAEVVLTAADAGASSTTTATGRAACTASASRWSTRCRRTRSRDLAQQPGLPAELRARHADGSAEYWHDQRRGTKVTFKPDTGIFETTVFADILAASARAGVPERRHHHHARRRATARTIISTTKAASSRSSRT